MGIEFATQGDLEQISLLDKHIQKEELARLISVNRVLVAKDENKLCGWLRYNLFWDNTPFMNLIYVLDKYQGKGIGKQLVAKWEQTMKKHGHNRVLTSTLSNEEAQHFYRKLGYIDCGSLLLPNEPLEILFIKEI